MILGIDAGGTKTRAIVIDENGDILYDGKGGAGNPLVVGVEGVYEAISNALGKFKEKRFEVAILGLGGAGFDKEARKELAEKMKKVIEADKIEVYNDCYVAVRGAIGRRKRGMIVLAGTGSMVIGIDERGNYYKAGGWGHLLGDEGSGYKISYDAIRAVMAYWEGMGPYTTLKDAVERVFGFKDFNDVVRFFYVEGGPRDKIASFSPYVLEYAEKGDYIAKKIVRENIKELTKGVGSVKLRMGDDYTSYGGGMFNSSYYRNVVREELKLIGFELFDPILSPIGGALFMGLSRIGILNDELFEKLKGIR